MTINKSICIAATLLVACCWANSASAWGPYFHDYWGWSGLGHRCSTVRDFSVPYYAVYPPVYYAESVARPYGYSPFAYPPGTPTPSGIVSSAEPVRMDNGFVSGRRGPQKAAASGPQRIQNPFVSGAALADPTSVSPTAAATAPSTEVEILQPPPFR